LPPKRRPSEAYGSPYPRELTDRYELIPQGVAAERVAERWGVERGELDAVSMRSHQRAAAAWEEGRFDRETVAVAVDGEAVRADQGIRADSSIEALAALAPAFEADGRVTAGNSSQISDGAAALLLASAAVSACPHLRGGPHWHRSRPGGGNSRQPQSRWSIRHRYRRRYTRSSSQEDPPWVESIGGPGR
jgi:acetyl-CoA acetyltransferase